MSVTKSELFHSHDYATLTVNNETGTEVAVAGVQGVTIVPEQEVDQLYTADSTKVADQIQYDHAVNVELEFVGWDGDFAKEWLGGSGATSSTWTDTTDPELFQLATYNHPSRDDSIELDVTVDNITFTEMPLIEWSEGEYASWNLTGTGEDVSNYDVAAPV